MAAHVPAHVPALGPIADAPTSRVVRRMAEVAALTPLPSGLWRIAGACGVPLGFGVGSGLHPSELGAMERGYLVVLSLLAEVLAFLTVGLVRHWGEVLPRWIPWLGGRAVPPMAAFVPAILGASLLTLLGVAGAVTWNGTDSMGAADAPDGAAYWVMSLCYLPLVAWGPLLAVVAVAYLRRRRARHH